MAKKLSVKIDGEKFKDGDRVTVVLTGRVRVSDLHGWSSANSQDVYVEYGDHEFYLTDAVDGATSAKSDGVTILKAK